MKHATKMMLAVAVLAMVAIPAQVMASTYSDTVLADNPLGYWRLGESSGTTAYDAVTPGGEDLTIGSGVTLGVTGALTNSSGGDTDTAVTFATGNIQGSSATKFDFTASTSFTAEAWLKTTNDGDAQFFLSTWTSNTSGFFLGLFNRGGTGGRLTLGAQINDTDGKSLGAFGDATTPDLADGKWHHVALTRDHTGTQNIASMGLFVDGVKLTSLNVYGNSTLTAGIDGSFLRLGNRDGGLHYNGSMDEAAIYDSKLSDAEILEHHTVGVPEPATMSLLGIGGLLALVRRRRK